MLGIDINFSQFEKKLFQENREASFLTTIATLGLTTAGAMTGTAVLSAISAGLIGTKAAFDSHVLLDRAILAIHTQMRAQRDVIAARLRSGMRQDVSAYPLALAITDIEAYYNAGTLLGAFVGITESAGVKAEKASTDLENVILEKAKKAIDQPVQVKPQEISPGEKPPGLKKIEEAQHFRIKNIMTAQKALGVFPPDGVVGSITRDAITEFQLGMHARDPRGWPSPKNPGELTGKTATWLTSMTPMPPTGVFRSPFERAYLGGDQAGFIQLDPVQVDGILIMLQLTKEEMSALSQGASPEAIITAKTKAMRDKIALIRTDKKIEPAKGPVLDSNLFKELEKMIPLGL
jgi:hypothetical protein